MLALLLGDGDNLIQVVVPKPLLDMGRGVMQKTFLTTITKKIEVFDFNRADDTKEVYDIKFAQLQRARDERSIIITTPETVKALMLKYVDLLERVKTLNPALSLPKAAFATKHIFKEVEREAEAARVLQDKVDALGNVIAAWRTKAVALLDEVDTLFHPLRSELNFPIGKSEDLHLIPDRYEFPLFMFDAVFYQRIGRTSTHDPVGDQNKILTDLAAVIDRGISELAFQNTPHPILLKKPFYHEFMKPLLARWAMIWVMKSKHIQDDVNINDPEKVVTDITTLMTPQMEQQVRAYISARPLDKKTKEYVTANFTGRGIMRLNLARSWLQAFIPHSLSKINRVDYGLLQAQHLDRWREEDGKDTQSPSRLAMAVPFVGKDVPSRHSEFAHPEVLIGMTTVSYRYQGLRPTDIKELVMRLKEKMQAEPGDYFQRPSRILFGDWCNKYKTLQAAKGLPVEKILPLELFPIGRTDQIDVLMRSFAHLPEVVSFYLKMAFQRVLKYKHVKLQASGVDIGSEILFKTRLGCAITHQTHHTHHAHYTHYTHHTHITHT